MNSVLSESPLSILSNFRIEAIQEVLSENDEFCDCFRLVDDRLNELLKIVPKESRSALCDIESAIGDIVSISNDLAYKQGLQDGLSMLKQNSSVPRRKPQYMIMEFESRRKDACRQYKDSKTGSIYRILKIVKEYTDETEADRDMVRLRTGEISEENIIRKRKRQRD